MSGKILETTGYLRKRTCKQLFSILACFGTY